MGYIKIVDALYPTETDVINVIYYILDGRKCIHRVTGSNLVVHFVSREALKY